MSPAKANFSAALRTVWKARGNPPKLIEDEWFKQPTLAEVEALAADLEVHPLTLLLLAYCRKPRSNEFEELSFQAVNEVFALFPVGEPTCAEDML